MKTRSSYLVVVRRTNGRFVKETKRHSKYGAKSLKRQLEEKYDDTFYVTIEEVPASDV